MLDAGSGQELVAVPRIHPAAYVVTTWENRLLPFAERTISASRLPRPLMKVALAAAEQRTGPGSRKH